MDVVWGPSGPVLLIETPTGAVVHAVGGFDTEVTVPAATTVTPAALVTRAGQFWVTGTTVVAGDSDAFLARLDATGGGLETRRFDIRGSVFAPGQQVIGRGLGLAVVPGDPDTLVVSGSSEVDRGQQWALAAFNGLEGALSSLAYTDLVLPVVGHTGAAVGLAGASGAVVAAGALLDGSTTDNSLGMARVLIDSEKRCDLALAIVSPVELLMRGTAPSDVTLRITNNGRRPCSGAISIPAPWAVAGGNADVGRLPARRDHNADPVARVRRGAPERRDPGTRAVRGGRLRARRQRGARARGVLLLRPGFERDRGTAGDRHRRLADGSRSRSATSARRRAVARR